MYIKIAGCERKCHYLCRTNGLFIIPHERWLVSHMFSPFSSTVTCEQQQDPITTDAMSKKSTDTEKGCKSDFLKVISVVMRLETHHTNHMIPHCVRIHSSHLSCKTEKWGQYQNPSINMVLLYLNCSLESDLVAYSHGS